MNVMQGGYLFNEKLPLWLYGINQYSETLIVKLKEQGFNIQGFIDKRAEELGHSMRGFKVAKIEDMQAFPDACVIITLMNALNHEAVAEQLREFGVTRILFLPMSFIYTPCVENVCDLYNRIVYLADFSETSLPYYDDLTKCNVTSRTKIIPLSEKSYLVYVPFNMIYTAFKENKKYADKPILSFIPYRELFDYFAGISPNANLYLQEYGVYSCNYTNSYTNDFVLQSRKKLYSIWEKHYYFNDGYFDSGAPVVVWNDKGKYFNLMEGQHRILYLILKGSVFVPVRLDKRNFEKSMEVVNEMIESKSIEEWKKSLAYAIESKPWKIQ